MFSMLMYPSLVSISFLLSARFSPLSILLQPIPAGSGLNRLSASCAFLPQGLADGHGRHVVCLNRLSASCAFLPLATTLSFIPAVASQSPFGFLRVSPRGFCGVWGDASRLL